MADRKLPFKCRIIDKKPVKVTNPFSGDSVMLEPDEVAVYDVIMGSQLMKKPNYDLVRKGIDWIIKHNPKAYMVLLD